MRVQPGTLLGERFELEMLTASGGMGQVYRAVDRQSGRRVAVKILAYPSEIDSERFARETEIIATLRHPRIVEYLAHGGGPETPWLAMEWLEGVSLATSLARGPLGIERSLGVVRSAAEGLTVLHARGLVHRDVKPSNLFLVGGEVERLKLLDFGVVRAGTGSTVTRSGALVGTPGYVAPEQARGGQPLDARADVFALGCVLFECLTGRAAFAGEHMLAALAKILLEDPPRANDICSGVPHDLEELLARMISKTPADRPRDAAAVLAELGALAPLDERQGLGPSALTSCEQRLLSIIVATGQGVPSAARLGSIAGTRAEAALVPIASEADALQAIRQLAALHGGWIVTLAGGSLLVVLRSAGAATDLAARAARCALALRERLPRAGLAIATGRGVLSGSGLAGEVIDRGVHLVRLGGQGVRVDEVTAGLVDGRFEMRSEGGHLTLWAEVDADDSTRALLGRPTPFIGREDELVVLTRAYEATAADRNSRAVLVQGAPGIGKSRLARELCALLLKRHPAPAIWKARGDPMRASSPFGLLATAIRRLCSIHEGDPLDVQRQKLAARLPGHLAASDRRRVCEFMGELSAIHFADDESRELRAARRDPMLMAQQIRLAWEDLVAAESAERTLVLVLEDLHWADMASMKLIQALLRRRQGRAVFVLALARPEMTPWQEGGVQQVHLGELSESACQSLVRVVLGASATGDVAGRLAAQAAGNALLLEELILATAEGKPGTLPDAVLAVLAARLERLEPEPRRLLRAASVFGTTFWTGGLAKLVGSPDSDVREWLTWLVDHELLHQRTQSRFDGQIELVFHHALLRDAAYALLTESDRQTGHRLAAEWLERAGESDPAILADQFERGGEPRRAIEYHLRSAERALEGNDLDAGLQHAQRGVACGAEGEMLGRLHLVEAIVHNWSGHADRSDAAAVAALACLPQGGTLYYTALQQSIDAQARLSRGNRTQHLFETVASRHSDAPRPEYFITCARLVFSLLVIGRLDEAKALMDLIVARGVDRSEDPSVRAHCKVARALMLHYAGDVSEAFHLMLEAATIFEGAAMLREACVWRQDAGFIALEAGAPPQEIEPLFRKALVTARDLNIETTHAGALQNLGLTLLRAGRFEEARQLEEEALRAYQEQHDLRMQSATHMYLALALSACGDLAAAEREARSSVDGLGSTPTLQPGALATLARILLLTGRVDEALAAAERGRGILEGLGVAEEGESLVRLTWAEALEASGQHERAGAAFDEASRRLHERAQRIADPTWRRLFLEAVPENARTLEGAGRYRGKAACDSP
jgi:tetratricopeptide (TPR) repeat protein